MKNRLMKTEFEEYDSIEGLKPDDKHLYKKAIEASQDAYAPYSKFQVGAALILENGKVIKGNNQENAAYPSGLCAERVALFYANANYPDIPVKAMAIVAFKEKEMVGDIVTPCGNCRQAMLETELRFDQPIRLIMGGAMKIWILPDAKSMLPLSFTSDSLE